VGQEPEPRTGAVIPPLWLSTTYRLHALGKYREGYEYSRTQQPNRRMLEAAVASLEGGRFAFAYASGMAAVAAVMDLLEAGGHAVVSANVYGGTWRLFEKVLRGHGLDFSFVDTSDLKTVERAARPATRMLFVETPTNPLLTLTDLRGASALARRRKWILAVDNTFMSPVFQRPLALGADVVIHSSTKFLNGHSDSVGGLAVTSSKKFAERLYFVQKSVGAVLSPFDCYLVQRSLKTLELRMRRHEENGRRAAAFLQRHPKVRKVFYPGLPSHPQRALAKRQMSGFGALVTFEMGSYARAKKFLDALRLCTLAESLGGVETLISHPASMTHASVPPEERRRLGITEGLVRLSAGIEDGGDLVEDLRRGLERVR
jgi:cystathionine beta-lyase/cystathionine gamma-synthase